jgi:hypothetical protein
MARMIPSRFDGTSAAERRMFGLFRDRLSDMYNVFHSVDWLRRESDRAVQGEADFIVVSRNHGLMAIECKGGGIGYDAAGNGWFTVDHDGAQYDIRDPVRQARDSINTFRRRLFMAGISNAEQAAQAHAVCFPDCHRAAIPARPGLPPDLVLAREDLDDIEKALLRVWRYYDPPGRGALESERHVQAVLDTLAPSFAAAWSLTDRIDEESRILVRLTEEQFNVIEMMATLRRALIDGCAGSGKTLLAIEKARRLAREGARVLFVCFNLFLEEEVRRRLAESGESVDVHSFESLCRRMCAEAGISWTRPSQDKALPRFFDVEAPALLVSAASRLGPRYDALVVDEGQDFLTPYYAGLEALLDAGPRGVLYVFADSRQDVYRRAPQYPARLAGPITLPYNCRNTVAISRLLERLSGEPVRTPPSAPAGEDPVLRPCRTREAEKDAVRSIIQMLCGQEGLSPSRITVLSCRSVENSVLAGMDSIAGFRLAHNVYPRPKGSILLTSLLRYKGLESDVVIVTDVDPAASQATDVHLYVGASRARLRLFMVGTVEGLRRVI